MEKGGAGGGGAAEGAVAQGYASPSEHSHSGIRVRAPEEEVVGVRREAAVLEEPKEVVELTMDVTHQLQRRLELEEGRLVGEYGDGRVNEETHVVRGEGNVGPWLFCRQNKSEEVGAGA